VAARKASRPATDRSARRPRAVSQAGELRRSRKASLQTFALQYGGRERLGRIVCRGKFGFEAFDVNDVSLGILPNLNRAADAVDERAA
jgi:hypothetical protein